jgi:hypothetical protein
MQNLRTLDEHIDTQKARIAELEASLEEARKDADYWDVENGRMLELCRTKLGKRDVHGVADGIEQLAGAREDRERLEFVISAMNCWDMYGQFHEAYHPTKRTSELRGTDAQWRAAIDAARGKP